MSPRPTPRGRPPEGIEQRAAERAERLLAGRLDRSGIRTTRPEWYFQTDPQAAQMAPGGWQVRVRTWRHWSDARVHLDADSGEVMHRCIDRLSDPPTDDELDPAQAETIARGLLDVPKDAALRSFGHEYFADRRKVARLEWEHIHRGMRVDGDYLWVMIHPGTHRLVAFGRKWRKIS